MKNIYGVERRLYEKVESILCMTLFIAVFGDCINADENHAELIKLTCANFPPAQTFHSVQIKK